MLSSTLTVCGIYHIFQAVFDTIQDRSEISAFGMKRNGVQMIHWKKKINIKKKKIKSCTIGINHYGEKKIQFPAILNISVETSIF